MNAKQATTKLRELEANIEKIIRGKLDVVRMAIIGLLAHGHILFEDVPGVGKTTLAQALAQSLGLSFQRIQFTSDLLPSDILGVTVFDPQTRQFEFRSGPIFANVVLADEINRTTPKTQSALLEAMNSAQVSIDRATHDLPQPFLVMATQNPVESHGTFPLPQSQLDRFLMRLNVGYPSEAFEREILMDGRRDDNGPGLPPVVSREELMAMQRGVREVKVDGAIVDYMLRLVRATRNSPGVEVGISTRGALALRRCCQAKAYLDGRDYCVPDDLKAMAVPALAHRIVPARSFEGEPEAMGQGSAQIRALLEEIDAPV